MFDEVGARKAARRIASTCASSTGWSVYRRTLTRSWRRRMVSLVGRSPANAGVSVPGMVSFVLTPVDSVWRPRIFSDLSRRGSPPARFVIVRSGSAHHIGALASLGSRETMYAIVKTEIGRAHV